jgi:hypothetical protein
MSIDRLQRVLFGAAQGDSLSDSIQKFSSVHGL